MTEPARGNADRPYHIRPIRPDEFDRFELVDQHGFHGGPMSEDVRRRVLERFEYDRSLAAFEDDTPVGVTVIYSFQLTVPGHQVRPAAGVTWVSVLPTHRRRGVLSSIMTRQLNDIRDRGESLAILWASEAGIYSRYGYGRASWNLAFSFLRGEGALAKTVPADPDVVLRLVEPPAALPELAKVYDAVLPSRPGLLGRNESWWERTIHDPAEERHGASPLRCLLAEDDSGPRGYALYSAIEHPDSDTFLATGSLTVRELMAADPAAGAALWANLLSRDLTTEFHARQRPVDDPLLSQLADPRRARATLTDALWVRITDVPGALAGRRYSAPVDLVIEVRDDLLPANAGRWRLTTAGAGDGTDEAEPGLAASCVRVTPETPESSESPAADVAMDITELGAAYLGGTRVGALAEAGLVTELRPGACRELSAAMSWDPAPWCPTIF